MPIGPSTDTSPYLLGSVPEVRLTSILTAGDALPGGGVFAGNPDGMAAFDNGDGTITVLVVHELPSSAGIVRDHGDKGSFIDRLVIDKATLQVIYADDLIQTMMRWSDSKDLHYATVARFSKMAGSDLSEPTAYFNPVSGLGTDVRILLVAEESGTEGRIFATVTSGPGAGVAWELPFLGNMTFEVAVANPFAQDKTIVALTDDSSGGQVYFYIGAKQATGSDIARAGLMNGDLYGLKVEGILNELNGTPSNGTFTLQEIGPGGDVSNMTGSQIEAESDAEGVTGFLRPEDAVWDPNDPNTLYFVTTASFSQNSRLYKASFTDITRPELGGTIEALLVGNEGHRMLDNIEFSDGKLILQEDPGDRSYLARIWEYDLATDRLEPLARFDPALFSPGGADFISQYEESSGVLDVTDLLGDADTRAYLVGAQVHLATGDPATYEMGQIMVMYVDEPTTTIQITTFGSGLDTYVQQARPASSYGGSTVLKIDGDAGLNVQAMLAFTGLFGDDPGQIPLGATITSAMLTVNVTNSSSAGATIYRLTADWTGESSWSSLGDGIQVGTETASAADLVLGSTGGGSKSFDVTASLIAWLNGATSAEEANLANKGWVFFANGTDGLDFSSFEGTIKPQLTVTYTLPAEWAEASQSFLAAATPDSIGGDARLDPGPDHRNMGEEWRPAGLADHHEWGLFLV